MSTFAVKPICLVEILPHTNADSLEILKIFDYQCVVKKGQFRVGDYVLYVPEAAEVPEDILKAYGFWNNEKNIGVLASQKGNRVKAIKLRGEISQGIVLPLDSGKDIGCPFFNFPTDDGIGAPLFIRDMNKDYAEELGITKWEPPIPVALSGEVFNLGQNFTVDYDVENLKAWPNVICEGDDVEIREKLHGCADFHTIIDTLEYGLIEIGKLVENKLSAHVKSFDIQTNEIIYSLVVDHMIYPNNKQWYELETENGNKVKLTGNHLVWLPELQCYRKVEELTKGDIFLLE